MSLIGLEFISDNYVQYCQEINIEYITWTIDLCKLSGLVNYIVAKVLLVIGTAYTG